MPALSGKRVLVVEDEWFLAEDLRKTLEAAGATVVGPFADSAEARAVIGGSTDFAVLDVSVRDGTTYPLAGMLRERNIPIVFLTGFSMQTEPVEWHSAHWITKPCEPARVVALLKSALPPETPLGELAT